MGKSHDGLACLSSWIFQAHTPNQGRPGSMIEEIFCGDSAPGGHGPHTRASCSSAGCRGGVKVKLLVAQSCPTLWDHVDYSSPSSTIHGILQARTLEWVATPSRSRCGAGGLVPTNAEGRFHLHPSDRSKSHGQLGIRSDIGDHVHSPPSLSSRVHVFKSTHWISWRGF